MYVLAKAAAAKAGGAKARTEQNEYILDVKSLL